MTRASSHGVLGLPDLAERAIGFDLEDGLGIGIIRHPGDGVAGPTVAELAQRADDHGPDRDRLAALVELGDERLDRFGLLAGIVVQIGVPSLA